MDGKLGNEDIFSRNMTTGRRCGLRKGFFSFLTLMRRSLLIEEFKHRWHAGLLRECFRAGGDRIQIMRKTSLQEEDDRWRSKSVGWIVGSWKHLTLNVINPDDIEMSWLIKAEKGIPWINRNKDASWW